MSPPQICISNTEITAAFHTRVHGCSPGIPTEVHTGSFNSTCARLDPSISPKPILSIPPLVRGRDLESLSPHSPSLPVSALRFDQFTSCSLSTCLGFPALPAAFGTQTCHPGLGHSHGLPPCLPVSSLETHTHLTPSTAWLQADLPTHHVPLPLACSKALADPSTSHQAFPEVRCVPPSCPGVPPTLNAPASPGLQLPQAMLQRHRLHPGLERPMFIPRLSLTCPHRCRCYTFLSEPLSQAMSVFLALFVPPRDDQLHEAGTPLVSPAPNT